MRRRRSETRADPRSGPPVTIAAILAVASLVALFAGGVIALVGPNDGGWPFVRRALLLLAAGAAVAGVFLALEHRARARTDAAALRRSAELQGQVIDRLHGLQMAITSAARASSADAAAAAIVREGMRSLGARGAALYRRDGGRYERLAAEGATVEELSPDAMNAILDRDEPLQCATRAERVAAGLPAKLGFFVAVQLHVGLEAIGVLVLLDPADRPVPADGLAHIRALADAGAVALRRVALHQQLMRRNALYTAISDGVSDVVFAKDVGGRYLYINEPGTRIIGRSRDDIIGSTDDEFMSADDARKLRAHDTEVMGSGAVAQFEEMVSPTASSPRVFRSTKAPLRDAVGAIVGVVGISRDVTHDYQLERALKRIERRFRALTSSSAVGIMTGVGDNLVEVNTSFLRMLGYPDDAPVSTLNATELTPPEWREADRVAATAARTSGSIPVYEKEFWKADGSRLPALIAGAVLPEPSAEWIALVTDLSELRAVEAELRHSESRYRTLAEATTSVIWTADASGAMAQPLADWEEYTGQSFHAAEGYGWLDAVHPDDRSRLVDDWLGHRDRVASWEGRVRLWHARSARHRYVLARAVPVVIDGVVEEWIATITDTHDRTVAEMRAADDAKFRRAVLQSLQDGLLVTDGQGRVIECNDAWTRVSGFTRSESLGAVAPYPWWPDADDDAATAAALTQMVEQVRDGTSGEWEVTFRHRDGHLLPVITSIAVLRDAVGALSMAIGTVKDITERKATEDALRTERDHRQAIVAALQEGLCVTDAQGTILDVNDGWTQITGYSRDESIGVCAPYPWWPAEASERALLEQSLVKAAERSEYADIEASILRADGTRRRVVLLLHPLPEAENSVQGFVTTMRDITRRSAAEAQLRTLADLAAELSSRNEPEEVGRAALALLMPELDADIGALLQVEDEHRELHIVTTVGTDPAVNERFRQIPLDLPTPATDAARLRELVVVVDDDANVYPTLQEFRVGNQLQSNVDVPLCKGDTVVGVLMFGFRRRYRPSPEVEELLHAVAPILAQALERARLFAFERSVAATLQEAMLAPYPIVAKEFAVAARYEPAVATLEVGGDWYDVITLEDGRLAVAVGDTVGRGLTAAAVMGQLRSALHAIAHTTEHSSEAVAALDRFALEIPGAKAATLVYAIVDPTLRTVTYTSAGHPPPLVIEPNGDTRFLEGARSWPLAVASPAKARVEAVDTLAPGSTLLCYTDGLIERRGEHLGTGLERLAREAARLANAPVEDLCDELLATLVGAGEHGDDVGLVALRAASLDTPAFTCRIPADARELVTLRRTLRDWLDRQGVFQPAQDDIVLAVGEACTNAIEHAYRDDHARGPVVVEGRRGDDSVVMTVRDHGAWRPRPPDPRRNRGLRLMDDVMDEVIVSTPADGGTRVRMRRGVTERQASSR